MENCGVCVTARQPQFCPQGDTYSLELEVRALRDVCEVHVTAMLPPGVSLIRSTPEGLVVNGRNLKWDIDGMTKGESLVNHITLRAECEGSKCVCFCVTAIPVQFCTVLCARPILECSKVGPCEVGLCDQVNYCISVTNVGSCAAEDVVVIDEVPPELEHCSCQKSLTFPLGRIEPCQTKKFPVSFTAKKLGKACNRIIVNACNACSCQDMFCTLITRCGISMIKKGPTEMRIGGLATYDVEVTNTGNKLLTDVVITECAPTVTTIVEANGAKINGNQALWKFAELKPGESQTVQVGLTSCTPAYTTNRASVLTAQGCSAQAEAGTQWRGSPSINAQIVGPGEPLCVGDQITYYVRVVNQGIEPDHRVSVVVRFPPGVYPVDSNGPTPGTIAQNVLTFEPLNVIAPKQVLDYRIDAVTREPGESRILVEVTSDEFPTPLTQTVRTVVH